MEPVAAEPVRPRARLAVRTAAVLLAGAVVAAAVVGPSRRSALAADAVATPAGGAAEALREILAGAARADQCDAIGDRIAELGPDVLPPVLVELERAGQGEESAAVARCLLSALERFERPAVGAALKDRLATERAARQSALLRGLGAAGGARSVRWIAEVASCGAAEPPPLEDPVRATVGEVLLDVVEEQPGALRDVGAEALRLPEDIGWTFASAVGAAEAPASLEILAELLGERPRFTVVVLPHVRRIAERYPNLVSSQVQRAVRWRLEDGGSSAEVREVVLALGALRDWSSVPTLIDLLSSEESRVAGAAQEALQSMTGLAFTGGAAAASGWYAQERSWFDGAYDRAIDDLQRGSLGELTAALGVIAEHRFRRGELAEEVCMLLSRDAPLVRVRACHTLATLGAPEALLPLVECLEDHEEPVRAAAHAALVRIFSTDLGEDAADWRAHFRVED